jgi:hypothetical protein
VYEETDILSVILKSKDARQSRQTLKSKLR